MAYALILEPSASRAAQYAFIAELAQLTPITCRAGAEALFQVERLGPPTLIIAESTLPDGDGLSVLRNLRQRVSVEQARALMIVDSKQAHEAAARQMIQLGISALILRSQTIPALEKAIRSALARSPQAEPLAPPTPPPPLPSAPPRPLPPVDPAAALAVAERLAEDPLVGELASLPLLDEAGVDESLSRVAASTARVFSAPIAMLWVTRSDRSWFKLHDQDRPKAARAPALWTAVRSAIGNQPVHVADATARVALAAGALVRNGLVGSFAGAPLLGTDGQPIGAVAVAHPQPNGIAPGVLEPLQFWAGRIASELSLRDSRARPAGSDVSAAQALEAAMAALGSAVLISDAAGLVCFANTALKTFFGLRVVRITGLRREDVIRAMGVGGGMSDETVRAIAEAKDAPAPVEFPVVRPEARVLRWESRPIGLGARSGRFDEFRDVTSDAARVAELSRVDPLSGLSDRRGADEALGREVSRALRTGEPLGVAIFEPDGLEGKPHDVTDKLLRAIAWVLRESVRGYDLAARFGPRQLIAILPGATAQAMAGFGKRFCKEVREMHVEGLPRATISGGAAQFDKGSSVDALIDAAIARLIEARSTGGDRLL